MMWGIELLDHIIPNCPACDCSYDSSYYAPQILPCSHTLCYVCLSKEDQTKKRRCPLCKEKYTKFTYNKALGDALDRINHRRLWLQTTTHRCDECDQRTPATYLRRCMTCEDNMSQYMAKGLGMDCVICLECCVDRHPDHLIQPLFPSINKNATKRSNVNVGRDSKSSDLDVSIETSSSQFSSVFSSSTEEQLPSPTDNANKMPAPCCSSTPINDRHYMNLPSPPLVHDMTYSSRGTMGSICSGKEVQTETDVIIIKAESNDRNSYVKCDRIARASCHTESIIMEECSPLYQHQHLVERQVLRDSILAKAKSRSKAKKSRTDFPPYVRPTFKESVSSSSSSPPPLPLSAIPRTPDGRPIHAVTPMVLANAPIKKDRLSSIVSKIMGRKRTKAETRDQSSYNNTKSWDVSEQYANFGSSDTYDRLINSTYLNTAALLRGRKQVGGGYVNFRRTSYGNQCANTALPLNVKVNRTEVPVYFNYVNMRSEYQNPNRQVIKTVAAGSSNFSKVVYADLY